jgi:hypothetical protein
MLLVLSLPFSLLEIVFFFMLGESGILRALAAEKMLEFRPDYHFMNIVKYSIAGVYWSILVITPFFLSGYLKWISNRYCKPALLISLFFFSLVIYFTTITNEINHVLLLSTLALLGFLMGSSQLSKMTEREAGFLSLLMVFPFILHFGSNVYFFRLGIHYWVFWILAVFFVVRFNKFEWKIIFQCLLPILSLILVFNGISLYSFNFYNYNEETAFWEYRKGKSIRIPLSEIDLYSNLIKLTSLSEESNVLPIFRNPGLVYMIGKSHPRTPGLWSRDQLKYYFLDTEPIGVIFYNDTFGFPFDRSKWNEKAEFTVKGEQKLQVFWKK